MNIFLSAWDDAPVPPLSLVGQAASAETLVPQDLETALAAPEDSVIVVFYPEASVAVSRRLGRGLAPEAAVRDWALSTRRLLKIQRDHLRRVTLVSAGDFGKAPDAFLDGIGDRTGAALAVPEGLPDPSPDSLSNRDVLFGIIAGFALEADADARSLAEELEAAAIYCCDPAEPEPADADRAMAAWRAAEAEGRAAAERGDVLERTARLAADQLLEAQAEIARLSEAGQVAAGEAAEYRRALEDTAAAAAALRAEHAETSGELAAVLSQSEERAAQLSVLADQLLEAQAEIARLQGGQARADGTFSELQDVRSELVAAGLALEEASAAAARWEKAADVLGAQVIALQQAVLERAADAGPGRHAHRALHRQDEDLRLRALVAAGKVAAMEIGRALDLAGRTH